MLENVEAIEPKKPAKLFVVTSMYGGLCTGGYTLAALCQGVRNEYIF